MRQAGRYLPEYRATRAKANGFLDLCFTPDLAVEVTLQPIRRYGFDGSILFSDILVVPHALGQKVWFEEGHGPRLTALTGAADIAALSRDGLRQSLAPVFEILRRLSAQLPSATTLIGFSGAPWTLACYMVEGGGSKDFAKTRSFAYAEPSLFKELIDLLIEAVSDYLCAQVEAGAEVLQLFDSWGRCAPRAGDASLGVGGEHGDRLTGEGQAPTGADHPFSPWSRSSLQGVCTRERGGRSFARRYRSFGVGAGTSCREMWFVQGNLDPLLLVSGGDGLCREAERILDVFGGGPFIFNLGHGIVPQTDPRNVELLVEQVRKR